MKDVNNNRYISLIIHYISFFFKIPCEVLQLLLYLLFKKKINTLLLTLVYFLYCTGSTKPHLQDVTKH